MAKGLKSRTKFNIVMATAFAGFIGFAYEVVGAIVGITGAQVTKGKIKSFENEFKDSETFIQRYTEDNAENERAFAEGEIIRVKYNENIEYYDSDKYVKDVLKSVEDPQYKALLKNEKIFFGISLSALGAAGFSLIDLIAIKVCEKKIDNLELEAEREKERENQDKERKSFEAIKEDEEDLERAKF